MGQMEFVFERNDLVKVIASLDIERAEDGQSIWAFDSHEGNLAGGPGSWL